MVMNVTLHVEEVLSDRIYRGKLQFLVIWRGYEEPTWEPADYLNDESGQPIVPLQRYWSSMGRG